MGVAARVACHDLASGLVAVVGQQESGFIASQVAPVTPEQLAKNFLRANVDKVEELLDTLASLGQARELPDGRFVSPPSASALRERA